jgi:hypothetical protein
MRILLTNNTLDARAGSELYVRDIAIELMRRGHRPVAYSTKLGAVAEELRAATVPVIDRLNDLAEPPDIIHGQHHYETFTALLRFPDAPAIYYCHGWLPWEEATLKHPNIVRYVAADHLCRERLIVEGGISPNRIEVVLNFFDQRLFPRRPPLPATPKRALVFSNYTTNHCLAVVTKACARCGIDLDVLGLVNGNRSDQPGTLLAGYDIVFAKARSAIEAMAVGASVVLCAPDKLGPMVNTKNFSSLRPWNFGIRTLVMPLDADLLAAELQKYNCEDAAQVSHLVRATCELQSAADHIVDIYQKVLAVDRSARSADRCQAGGRGVEYLERWANQYKSSFQAMSERDYWASRCNAAEQALAQRDEQSRQQTAHVRHLLSQRDAEATVLAQELRAVRASATWRWSQRFLQSPPVGLLFGSVIRSVAERSRPTDPVQLSSPVGKPVDAPVSEPAGLLKQEGSDPAVSNLQRQADRMISAHGFLGVPRGTFAQAGREQLIALLAEGLCPESKVLEFGCGCLRIAYWLIRFLDSGAYYGVEPSRSRVDCGLQYLFTPAELQIKRPHFDFNPVFNSSVFGTEFDFFLARSIWTHASKLQIEATLDSFLRDSGPHAIFLASYLPAQSPDDDYQGTQWVGTSHESDTPGVVRHAVSWIVEQCCNRGLNCEQIAGMDCDSQLWLRIRRTSQ